MRTIALLLSTTAVFLIVLPELAPATTVTDDEMTMARQWVAKRFVDGGESVALAPPFSFTYGGKSSAELLPNWKLPRRVRKLDNHRIEHTLTWRDRESGLVVRCVGIECRDFPTVEWTFYFKNTSKTDTPILQDIQAPDAFWSNAAPSLGSGIDIRVREIDYNALRRLVRQWRDTNANCYGDYYPLTACTRENNVWIAWQFHRPELGQGTVRAFRRADCPDAMVRLKLRGLEPDSRYEFKRLDTLGETIISGAELMTDGLTVSVQDQPGVIIFTYRRAQPRP